MLKSLISAKEKLWTSNLTLSSRSNYIEPTTHSADSEASENAANKRNAYRKIFRGKLDLKFEILRRSAVFKLTQLPR